jgi:Fe-S-cluster containining protein
MTIQQHTSVPPDIDHKKELLTCIYTVYSRWVERFPLACRKGCAACCTQSVTLTSLEGELILDFIREEDRKDWLAEQLAQRSAGIRGELVTTNQYARACLEHQEVAGDAPLGWNFTPCIFLSGDICSIYEVRPFGCRSFISLVQCSGSSGAEIAPVHLAVNTVFTQINEHLCSDGGYWSNMADILENLIAVDPSGSAENLQPAQPVPGFLLEPREIKLVHDLLMQLYEQAEEKQTFGDLIDNFMPIL